MVRKTNTKSKKGFTIIEVVLVLAIAGLIFLMVFIALPALQRSQRNTQRRDDYSMLVTAVNSYLSSNNGKIKNLLISSSGTKDPNTLVASRWVNSDGKDPNGNDYEVQAWTYDTWKNSHESRKYPGGTIGTIYECKSEDGEETCTVKKGGEGTPGSQVYIIIGANCNGADANGDPFPDKDSAARSFAVYGYVEGGGYFCQASGSRDTGGA